MAMPLPEATAPVRPALRPVGLSEAATRAPDFLLVGAPKCGTTALYSWLRQHPQIFLPEAKEPHFFGRDLTWRHRDPWTLERYLELFRDAGSALRVGEASTMYLFSKSAPHEIAEFNPGARIVAMVRNPVDVMYSFHSERLFGGNEDLADFAEALAAEEDRREGRRIPAGARLVEGCFYREVVRFSEQLERYFQVFGRDAVHVIVYDDFRADPAAAYEGVCKFLDVDPSHRPSFDVVNGNKTVRSAGIRKLLRHRAAPGRTLLRRALPPSVRRRIFRKLWDANTVYTRRAALDTELRRKLQIQLGSEVVRLSRLLDRDLRHWIQEA